RPPVLLLDSPPCCTQRPPPSTLFPYTTLFRSVAPSYDNQYLDRLIGRYPKIIDYKNAKVLDIGCRKFESYDYFVAKFHNENIIGDRKSTRLNSSHVKSSYAVFCLKKIKNYISI